MRRWASVVWRYSAGVGATCGAVAGEGVVAGVSTFTGHVWPGVIAVAVLLSVVLGNAIRHSEAGHAPLHVLERNGYRRA